MLSADPERAERHDGLLTSGGRSRGGILALCWVTPTPARRQHAAVSHERQGTFTCISAKTYISISGLSLCPGFISSRWWEWMGPGKLVCWRVRRAVGVPNCQLRFRLLPH